MINLNRMTLNEVNKGNATMYVKEISPAYEYKDGERTERIEGTTYTMSTWYRHTEIRVKVKGETQPKITQQMLDNSPNGMVEVTVTGFSARVYSGNNGGVGLSATATAVTPTQPSTPPQAKA